MNRNDSTKFFELLDNVFGLYGKQPTAGQKSVFFRALEAYPLEAISIALSAHMRDAQRGRFAPLPADVIAQLDGMAAADGRPCADEAWAIAMRAADEGATVVWTQEMADAWATVRELFGTDQVGARLAFRGAYERQVAAARQHRAPAVWFASLGHDAQRREAELQRAAAAGLLAHEPAGLMLEAPKRGEVPLLALASSKTAPQEARDALLRLRDRLEAQTEAPSHDAAERARTDELKAATAALVAAHAAA